MSQPHASGSMAQNSQTIPPTDSDNFQVIFASALETYKEKTKQSLESHALFTQLESCDSSTAILDLLRSQVNPNANDRLKKWLNAGVGLVYPPASVIFVGIGILLSAFKDLNEDQGTLVEIFGQIENFFGRLEVYTEVQPTPAMKGTMVKIMVEVLDILAIATKEMEQSRTKKFLKKLAGWTDMKDALKKLDKLTDEEARMAGTQVLKNTHVIIDKLTAVDTQVKHVSGEVQDVNSNVGDVKRNQLWESLRKWQSPPDPSINHNIACDRQHEGTAEWFFRGGIFKKWKVTGSMLWIHGKPGSGKSILCSAIIKDISTLYKAGSASMAYFYFDFRDTEKQSRRNLLPSLLIQLSAHSDPCFDILSRLYEAHDNGARQPNDSTLTQCLKEMITLPNHGPIYLILDGLDECPNTSEFPSARRQVLHLLKEFASLRLPNLHICVTSRPEVDIRDVIEPLAFHSVSLHDESGQKEDITSYVRSAVYSDTGAAMKRWRAEEKELVIKTLSDRADGMFRWVYCQLEALQNCLPQRVRQKLSELPKTLDETYERILKEVGKADGDLARQILQCLTAAIRPLSVEELAEILALNFEEAEGDIPKFDQDWRFQDQDLLITCSSLIAIVKNRHSQVVQFSHFSVKEFLTSDRLATPLRDISSSHILPESAHATLAQACLTVLLPFDDNIPDRKIKSNSKSPLAYYAAEHWVDHAQFEKVSLRVQDGMRRLFDQSRPYFTAWLELYNIDIQDDPWGQYKKEHASPLYYASLCGFRDLAEHLVKRSQGVNAVGGRHHSPLAAALRHRHTHVAELLYQHGADIELAGYSNRTLLVGGHVDAVRWLLEHGANVNSRSQTDCRASFPDPYDFAAFLSNDDGIANAAMGHAGSPLHLASLQDHFKTTQLLIQCGADVTSRDNLNSTPLHLAALRGATDSVELLIEHGSDVNARNKENSTPLHLALYRDNSDVVGMLWDARTRTVEILIRHGADVHARDEDNSTPLHLASSFARTSAMQLLIQHGADVTALDKNDSTPLHLASNSHASMWNSPVESIQLLIQHGADVTALDKNDSTPLHLASSHGRTNAMQLLIQHGADVTALDKSDSTPLHLASPYGWIDAMQLLIQHGADVTALDKNDSTPLHLASNPYGTFGSIQLLIQHGADVNARDNRKSTPLHLLAPRWKRGIGFVRLLLEHGADVDATDVNGRTPDDIALSISRSTSGRTSSASTEIARLIQDYRNRVRE